MSTWAGFKFINLPAEERHKFYRALKDAKIVAYEMDDLVFAETKNCEGNGNADESLGDIVPIIEIFHRTVDHLGGKVRFLGVRFNDEEVERIEHATSTKRAISLDEIYAPIREEDR